MRVFFYSPHPDDETLSMGLAMLHYIASGAEVHLVSMNNGGALGVANTLNGVTGCSTPSDHPYTHNPVREGYPVLTVEAVAAARINEARSALGAMAMIPPSPGVTLGAVNHHAAGLPDSYGHPGATSSTAPVTAGGVASAKAVIKSYVDSYPNSFHFTMSPTDKHYDHAACGLALRELKNDDVNLAPGMGGLTYKQALANSRFFVSRLYWDYDAYPQVAQQPGLAWFSYAGSRKAEYDNWLRTQVAPAFRKWNPAQGSYGIGYHQVPSQFTNNFGPDVSIVNLWHA
jgi:LmbE family N-acetylglucosaminyl deacetylase